MSKVEPKMLKAAVLGANDGIITTFAVVAGVMGAGLPTETIVILGVANMIADGISMALGDYLGEQSVNQLQRRERIPLSSFFSSTSGITFYAFVFAGTLPLIPYLLYFVGIDMSEAARFPLSIVSTAIALFVIGSARTIITKHGWFRSGLEMLAVGTVAAAFAYLLGAFIEQMVR